MCEYDRAGRCGGGLERGRRPPPSLRAHQERGITWFGYSPQNPKENRTMKVRLSRSIVHIVMLLSLLAALFSSQLATTALARGNASGRAGGDANADYIARSELLASIITIT